MSVETGKVLPRNPKAKLNFEEYQESCAQDYSPSFFQKCLHKISYIVWEQHRKLIKLFGKNSNLKFDLDFEFRKNELKIGKLSTSDLRLLRECIERSPVIPRPSHDFISGYFTDIFSGVVDALSQANHYKCLDLKKETKNVERVLSNIAPEIRSCLGHPFRVANVNCWGVMPLSAGFVTNAWHVDGYPPGMYKLIIYLNPAGKETGTSELLLPDGSSTIVQGPAGTWILFNSSTLCHRGLPAVSGERTVINVTIVPAFKENVYPVIAGMSANFPWFPWSIPSQNS